MSRPDFRQRSMQAELMDEATLDFTEFHDCLKQLAVINTATLAYRPTLTWLGKIMPQLAGPVRVLDIGCGGGDMLRLIAKRLHRHDMQLTGADLSAFSIRSAEISTPPDMNIIYETSDAFAFAEDKVFDIIINALFTHHLDDAQLVMFLKWLDRHATKGWIINDLHRHILPYYFIKYAVRLFSRNRLIRHDAPVSVARSFTKKDWQKLLQRSGIAADTVQIKWYFPFRYVVTCRKKI